jgi:hypothetical protein
MIVGDTMRLLNSSLLWIFAVCLSASSCASAAERIEVPIYQEVVQGHGGKGIRYWVWLKVGDENRMKALLDTGSGGLYVLATGLNDPDALTVVGKVRAAYDFGEVLIGRKVEGSITIGNATASEPMQFGLITSARCSPGKQGCVASQSSFKDYRIVSEGRPGQGYTAILGASLGPDLQSDEVPNPLTGVAQSWVVDLPRPGDWLPGKLILNPTERDLTGFQSFDLVSDVQNWRGANRSGIAACIAEGEAGDRVCGAISFDSGANSIDVETRNDDLLQSLRNAGTYDFEFGEGDNKLVWHADIPPNAFVQTDIRHGEAPLTIKMGYHIMWDFRVYYDFDGDRVGLKKR